MTDMRRRERLEFAITRSLAWDALHDYQRQECKRKARQIVEDLYAADAVGKAVRRCLADLTEDATPSAEGK